jgi:hypothetical protein
MSRVTRREKKTQVILRFWQRFFFLIITVNLKMWRVTLSGKKKGKTMENTISTKTLCLFLYLKSVLKKYFFLF